MLNCSSHGERTVGAGQPHLIPLSPVASSWTGDQPLRAETHIVHKGQCLQSDQCPRCWTGGGTVENLLLELASREQEVVLRTAQAATPLVPPEAAHIIVVQVNRHPYVG